jgi:predicted MFS family arabinose efflux permease
MVATIQLAITLGASVGGVVFDSYGYRATFGLSSGVLALGALLAFLAGAGVKLARQQRWDDRPAGSGRLASHD